MLLDNTPSKNNLVYILRFLPKLRRRAWGDFLKKDPDVDTLRMVLIEVSELRREVGELLLNRKLQTSFDRSPTETHREKPLPCDKSQSENAITSDAADSASYGTPSCSAELRKQDRPNASAWSDDCDHAEVTNIYKTHLLSFIPICFYPHAYRRKTKEHEYC